jgi:hypothetical protein
MKITSFYFTAILAFLCFSISVSANDLPLIEGRIIEKLTDQPLAYVNIGVVGKGVGTVSNTKGVFSLTIPSSLDNEIVRVSMVGYTSVEFSVSDFRKKISEDYNIFLEPKTNEIQEIAIVDSKMKSYLKGNKTKNQWFSVGFESDTLGNEFATKFKIRKRRTIIKDLRLSINENTFDTLRFRLNLYKIKNGKPGEIINTENIIVTTTKKSSEVLIVDLLPYNVVVEKGFFASIEWIENSEPVTIDENGDKTPDVSFSAAYPARTVYYRKTSHANWRSIKGLGIGMQVTILQ